MSNSKKRQTRRSISVKGLTYQWVQEYCDQTEQSISGFVEELIFAKMDELGVQRPAVLKPRPQRPEKKKKKIEDEPEIHSQHFTF